MSTLVRYIYLERKEGMNNIRYFVSSLIELIVVWKILLLL